MDDTDKDTSIKRELISASHGTLQHDSRERLQRLKLQDRILKEIERYPSTCGCKVLEILREILSCKDTEYLR